MTELVTFLPFAFLALLVGVFIGCVGIGGVLLVPGLVYLVGMEVQVAIATCMLSYLFSGAVGAVEYARRGSIQWSMALWLCVGAMPGAYLGAATVSVLSARWLEAIIAALVLFSGIYALRQRTPDVARGVVPGAAGLGVVGARVAHRLPAALLKRIVAFVLMAVGVAMVVRIVHATWAGAQA